MIDLDVVTRVVVLLAAVAVMFALGVGVGFTLGLTADGNAEANREARATAELQQCLDDRTVNTAFLHAVSRQTRDIVDAMGVR